jgi:ribosomal protein L13
MDKICSTLRSEKTNISFKKNSSEWYYYHSLYAERTKDWNEIPYIEIPKKIKERP